MAIRQYNDNTLVPGTQGTTVAVREMNGYNDSDFYATYWNIETNEPIEIQYCTTRGGSNGYADIDATADIWELYENWKTETNEREKRLIDIKERLMVRKIRHNAGITRDQFSKLANVFGTPRYSVYGEIENQAIMIIGDELRKLKLESHRSSFRKSIAKQVYDWTVGESIYDTPLSRKQLSCIGL